MGLHHHAQIDSTNEEARRLASSGARGPAWICADTQSAGRGRRGRAWMSEPGNLFCTHLYAPECPLPRAAELSFVTALSVHDAVEGLGVQSLALKWPNDLLIDGAKVSGILIESAPGPTGHPSADPLLAIGIGVNITAAPDDTPYPATCLIGHGVSITPLDLLARLATAFQARAAQWNRGAGFETIRNDWLARARGVGGPITIRLHDEVIEGEFVSLDADGALEIRAGDTLRKISAGDVFFPNTPSRNSA
ncbi:biotin--[acetyl-CoA-carboxylase] ligase [Candidatus Phaeomarinobacter ectocarpi]|uniref:biotin--[acetyl-CoA-carboxylase] ligase n=1 Tax=Candidatus Phaeomarinibacter ectocarpi TaxID=1458461 RepID=UPI0005C4D853|nr:biotin--[acetyl-CoA-carboxylase] ligase [Candidatus Phaeomarinobacter ectocarpi]